MFLRGRPDIARVIVRTPVKGQSNSQSIIGDDPDFYSYAICDDGKSRATIEHEPDLDYNSEAKAEASATTIKRRALAQSSNPSLPIQHTGNGVTGGFFSLFPHTMLPSSVASLPTTSSFPAFNNPNQPISNPLTTLQLLAVSNQQARQTFLSLGQPSNSGEDSAEQLRRLGRL